MQNTGTECWIGTLLEINPGRVRVECPRFAKLELLATAGPPRENLDPVHSPSHAKGHGPSPQQRAAGGL